MKQVKTLLTIASAFFLIAVVLTTGLIIKFPQNLNEKAAASTNLYILPRNQTVIGGDSISFSVAMDTGNNNVTGLDLLLKFDPNVLHISSLQKGTGITSFDNTITNEINNNAGTATFSVFTLNKNLAVGGDSIEVLQINAFVNSNAVASDSQLTFDSSSAVSATNETTSALLGTTGGTFSISSPPTTSPQPTSVPTSSPSNPNSCGGTCGSNANCESSYICYNGYCRNPYCSQVADCNCANVVITPLPTTRPTKAPTKTTKPIATAQTIAATTVPQKTSIAVAPSTQAPSNFWENVYSAPTVIPVVLPTLLPGEALPESKTTSLLPWIIGSLVIVGVTLILIAIRVYKHAGFGKKNIPPVIKI